MSASSVSKAVFYIKANDDKNKISTPMLYKSFKTFLSFDYVDARSSQKMNSGEFAAYSITSGPGCFKFGSSTGGSGFLFETISKINIEHFSGTVTGNFTSSSKGKICEENVM